MTGCRWRRSRLGRHGDVSRLRLCRHPGEGRDRSAGRSDAGAQKTQKAACSLLWKPQLQRLENPIPINALNALRDGASCSDAMGCGGYLGTRTSNVKPVKFYFEAISCGVLAHGMVTSYHPPGSRSPMRPTQSEVGLGENPLLRLGQPATLWSNLTRESVCRRAARLGRPREFWQRWPVGRTT